MKRDGNTIGGEGRRQGNTDPDRPNDRPDQLERLADGEIDEQRKGTSPVDGVAGATGGGHVQQDPQGIKPGTARKLEQADTGKDES